MARAIILQVHVNGVLRFTTFNDGHRTGIANQGIGNPVAPVHLLAAGIAIQQDHLGKRRDFQKQEGLHQPEEKTRATLIDVETNHVVAQTELAVNHIAGGRHEIVRRLRDEHQGANFLLFQAPLRSTAAADRTDKGPRNKLPVAQYGAGPGSSSS